MWGPGSERHLGGGKGGASPELEGVLGSSVIPSWLFISLSLHFRIGKMRALFPACAPHKCPDPMGLFVHDLI